MQVLHINLNQSDIWPKSLTGHADNGAIGGGAGKGNNRNFTLPAGTGDAGYRYYTLSCPLQVYITL